MERVFLYNLILIVMVMFLGWIFSLIKKEVTHIDSIWGVGFILMGWSSFFQTEVTSFRQILIPLLTTLWGLRLSLHLTLRNWGKGEDPRYESWRKRNEKRFFWIISLFKVFLLQALFLWVISFGLQYVTIYSVNNSITVFDMIGLTIWGIGLVIESMADWQLSHFINDVKNKGRVMNKYLWKYSRHPNYFGETLIWWGMFFILLSVPGGVFTIFSPVVITFVLLKLTGITLMEKDIVDKRPEYRDYIKTTSAFIPWFKKK